MEKGISYGLLIIVVGILIGMSTNMWSCGPVKVEGLILVDSTSSIGSSVEDESNTLYTYSFSLYNSGQDDIYITGIQPVLAQSPYIVSSSESLFQKINRFLESESSLTFEGVIELNAENVSKEEIADLKPIVYINVSSTQTIPYFAY